MGKPSKFQVDLKAFYFMSFGRSEDLCYTALKGVKWMWHEERERERDREIERYKDI